MIRQLVILSIIISVSMCAYPVAIIHGIGDSCSNDGMEDFTNYFSDKLGGVYAKCIETGGGVYDWFTSFKSQAEYACQNIKNDPNFQGDFSMVGISQGSLLARYIIQACNMNGRVKRYVSIGGPQMGVAKFPHCENGIICNVLNAAVDWAVFSSFVQNHIGPSGYFKDMKHYSKYLSSNTFIADLNNENASSYKSEYKERFSQLEQVVLIKFSRDSMILPKETAWFQFCDENYKVIEMVESDLYKNDTIGLKILHVNNKIQFVELEGNHLNFDNEDMETYMVPALS